MVELESALRTLVRLGADPAARNANGFSALDLLVRHGLQFVAWAHLGFGPHAEQHAELTAWRQAVELLVKHSDALLDEAPALTEESVFRLLCAYMPWTAWPTVVRMRCATRGGQTSTKWFRVALHGCVASDDSALPVLRSLLQARPAPYKVGKLRAVRWAGPLHLAAAGGFYEWEGEGSAAVEQQQEEWPQFL